MSETTQKLRESIENVLDVLEMSGFNDGFEAAINAIDELSNIKHNEGDPLAAEILRWTAKELRGENDVETN
jgi:soluble cytochrome b562